MIAASALALALAAGPARAGTPGGLNARSFGVLLLAESGAKEWQDTAALAARELGRETPVELAVGLGDDRAVQKAVDKLEARGARKIVAVPLFLDEGSHVMDEYRYLFGIRKDPSTAFLAAPGGMRGGAAIVRRARTKGPVVLVGTLEDERVAAEVLLTRALALSRKADVETVVLVGLAENSDASARRWADVLDRLAGKVRASGGFKASRGLALRGAAPQSVREKDERRLREELKGLSRESKVLVVPVAMTSNALRPLRGALSGVFMRYDGKALLPDARVARWAAEAARAGAKLPDMRTFKDAGRAAPRPSAVGVLR